MSEGCVFCDQNWMRTAEIFIETPHCVFVATRDPDIRARAKLAAPDGYLLGWNQGGILRPHLHVIPRFDDEPLYETGGCARRSTSRKTDGPIPERPGGDGPCGVFQLRCSHARQGVTNAAAGPARVGHVRLRCPRGDTRRNCVNCPRGDRAERP
jgi:hypothetical protein